MAGSLPNPRWTQDVVLGISDLARTLGVNRATLASRAGSGTQGDPTFPIEAIGGGSRGGRYVLAEVIAYAERSGLAHPGPHQIRLATHLVDVAGAAAVRESILLPDPDVLRQAVAREVGVLCGRCEDGADPHALSPSVLALARSLAADVLAEEASSLGVDVGELTDRQLSEIVSAVLGGARQVGRRARSSATDLTAVVAVAARLLAPTASSVGDPCVGEGGLLGTVVAGLADIDSVVGCDIDDASLAVARLRIRLAGGELEAVRADYVGNGSPFDGSLDLVVADLPFGEDTFPWLARIAADLGPDGWAVVACSDLVVTDHWQNRKARDEVDLARVRAAVRLPGFYRAHAKTRIPAVVVLGPAVPSEGPLLVDFSPVHDPNSAGGVIDADLVEPAALGALVAAAARGEDLALPSRGSARVVTFADLDAAADAWALTSTDGGDPLAALVRACREVVAAAEGDDRTQLELDVAALAEAVRALPASFRRRLSRRV